jgi:L-serine dehydratase
MRAAKHFFQYSRKKFDAQKKADISERKSTNQNFSDSANLYFTIELYGSLAATSIGHGVTNSVLAGLEGDDPALVDPEYVKSLTDNTADNSVLNHKIILKPNVKIHPSHTNAMRFFAYSDKQKKNLIAERDYFSIGGGAVLYREKSRDLYREKSGELVNIAKPVLRNKELPFVTMTDALRLCEEKGITLWQLAKEYELENYSADELEAGLKKIWEVMRESVEEGLKKDGILPGGLNVPRRAKSVFERLIKEAQQGKNIGNQKLMAYALAVAEQNADGQRVVTAPTNGSAGVIPAVLYTWVRDQEAMDVPLSQIEKGIGRFLLTANIICSIIRTYASIAGAEVGCQGEIGSASSMAAAGLTELYGGSSKQIENAAEIALEHHLGLTCDPIKGLVQIPCIERNAISARTAVSAAQLAMCSQGSHLVSLDKTIITMNETGKDMNEKYRETALGGLAKNFTTC